ARFEVKLTFDGIPERLVIPFAAIKVFFDPSVPYGLQFDEAGAASNGRGSVIGLNADVGIGGQISGVPGLARASNRPVAGDRKRPVRRARTEKDDDAGPLGEEITESPPGRRSERPQAALVPVATGTEGETDIAASPEQDPGQDN